jgi:hypothetical protein
MSASNGPTGNGPGELGAIDPEHEVVLLRRRLAELEGRPPEPPRHRMRRTATAVLAVLTVLALVATTVAVWTTRTGFQTDRFMTVVEPVLESPEVADALSVRLTDEVVTALDLETRLDARLSELGAGLSEGLGAALDLTPAQRARIETLPLPQLQDLAAPIASGLEARIGTRIDQFVRTPEFQRLLVEGTQLAHTKGVALLRGDFEELPNVEVEAGEVRLNLVPVIAGVLEDLVDQGLATIGIEEIPFIDPFADPEASIARLSDALGTDLPTDFGQLTVMSEAELVELQDAASAADQLVWVLLLTSIALLALTVAVAPRRRRALVQLSLGTAAGLVVTMALLRTTQDEVAGTAVTPRGRDALALLADATLDSLRSAMLVVLVGALLVAAVAHVLGRPVWLTQSQAWTRRVTAAQPGGSELQRFVVRYHDVLRIAVIAVAVLLLFALGIGLWTVLVLAVLVALALWGLSAVRASAPPSEPPTPRPVPGPPSGTPVAGDDARAGSPLV